MKYIIIGIIVLFNFITNTFASEYKQSSYYNFELKANGNKGKIELNWKPYFDTEMVSYYKLVYSKNNNNPDLNNSDSLTISNIGFKKKAKEFIGFGKYYTKLCTIIQTQDVFCGQTVIVNIDENKNISKKDLEDFQNRSAGKDEKIEIIKKYELSDKIKKKIEKIIKNYVAKLKKKKYSIGKINNILTKIQKKVEKIKPKYKNNEKLIAILDYLDIVLENNKIWVR